MKTPLLAFSAGAAGAVLIMWLIRFTAASGSPSAKDPSGITTSAHAVSVRLESELATRTARLHALEKELAALKSMTTAGGRLTPVPPDSPDPTKTPAGQAKMAELEQLQDQRDVSREVDRLTLRLKLTEDQKKALRTFLTDGKTRQRAALRAHPDAMEFVIPPAGQGMDAFLETILTIDQRADFEQAKNDERQSRAEQFAYNQARKLHRDLYLSAEQKDKLFPALAHQYLTSAATPAADAGQSEPPSAPDPKILAAILTPEQAAVYAARQKEEAEELHALSWTENGMRVEELPVALPTGETPEDGGDEDEDDQ